MLRFRGSPCFFVPFDVDHLLPRVGASLLGGEQQDQGGGERGEAYCETLEEVPQGSGCRQWDGGGGLEHAPAKGEEDQEGS